MTIVIAHDGFSKTVINNSHEDRMSAMEMNVDMIEMDIRLCKSKELVVHHDWRIEEDLIYQSTLDYLKQKHQLMSLRDVMETYHLYTTNNIKPKLLLDIKTPHYDVDDKFELIDKLVNVIHEYIENNVIDYDNIICSSFNKEILSQIYSLDNKIKLGYITTNLGIDFESLPTNFPIYSVSLYYTEITKDVLNKLNNKGLQVFLFTVNNIYDMENFIEMKVNGIITDYPDKIFKISNINTTYRKTLLN
jgi:glycerophosphoryl diester phosphodiesterase